MCIGAPCSVRLPGGGADSRRQNYVREALIYSFALRLLFRRIYKISRGVFIIRKPTTILSRSFFANPYTKNARSLCLNKTMVRYPPSLPCPSRVMRCLKTCPPKSASKLPASISAAAAFNASSEMRFLRANFTNHLLLKIRIPRPCVKHYRSTHGN